VLRGLTVVLCLLWSVAGFAHARPEAPPALQTISTPRFRIQHTERAKSSARVLAGELEEVRSDFARVLGRDWPGTTDIRLGYDRAEMEALALGGGKVPGWAVALAYPAQNTILLDAHVLAAESGITTLRHEMSHVALGQLGKDWPRWFQEGLAMYLTGDRFSLSQYNALFRGVTQGRISRFEDLREEWPSISGDVEIAYAQSASFISFLRDRHGPGGFALLLDAMQEGLPFETAFARSFRASLDREEADWKSDLPKRYSWWPIITGGSTLWVIITLLFVAAYLRRREQLQASLMRMDEETFPDSTDVQLSLGAEFTAAPEPSNDAEKDKPTLH
jgi:hypothetical protein